jgi:hypothetical protein
METAGHSRRTIYHAHKVHGEEMNKEGKYVSALPRAANNRDASKQ